MMEMFFWRGSTDLNLLQQFQNHSNLLLLSGPPSSGKTSLLFQFAFNVALHSNSSNPNVLFICNRHRLDSKPPFLSQDIDPSSDIFQRIQMKYHPCPFATVTKMSLFIIKFFIQGHVNRVIFRYVTRYVMCKFFNCLRYINDDEDIRKYFAAFHLHDTFPAAVVIDDFGDFFDQKICQQRYSNPRGRDLAMVKSLALCHNAITYANQKGSFCKLLLSDTHTHQGDSPRFHFIYKKWIHTTFTIKEGDVSGSFILKDRSYSRNDNTGRGIKAAKYSIALQYLVFDGIIEGQEE